MTPPYIAELFQNRDEGRRTTGLSKTTSLLVPFSRCKFGDARLRSSGSRYFNELPLSIRNLSTYKSFTTACYKFYQDCFYSSNWSLLSVFYLHVYYVEYFVLDHNEKRTCPIVLSSLNKEHQSINCRLLLLSGRSNGQSWWWSCSVVQI